MPKFHKKPGVKTSLILANLTKADFEHFHHHKIPYSGSAADPHFDRDPRRWGKDAPYIATFLEEFYSSIQAMKWERFSVQVMGNQWHVSKRLRKAKAGLSLPSNQGRGGKK